MSARAAESARHASAQLIITDDEFNRLLDEEVDWLLNDKHQEPDMLARLTTFTRHNFDEPLEADGVIAFGDMPAPDDRPDLFRGIGSKLARERWIPNQTPPVATIFLSEVWMLPQDKKDDDKYVSEHDDKQEAVMIAGLTVDGRTNLALYTIDRRGGGYKLTLDKYQPYAPHQQASMTNHLCRALFAGAIHEFKTHTKGEPSHDQ